MTEEINGYHLVTEWTTAGGGNGQWAFAEKNGKEYFIKRFLRPTHPGDTSKGESESKKRRRAACERFEVHHKGLMDSLSGLAGSGGHLVVTREFFRVGAKYYKVTDRIETASLNVSDIAKIKPPRKQVVLALSIAHSLEILHRKNIVHGDLKPANILPKATSRDLFVAKLIDFDDSYQVGSPPPSDEVVGDMVYYSPELLKYIQEEGESTQLGCAADIFALGIVFCEYFTGELPVVVSTKPDGFGGTIAQAAIAGEEICTGLEKTWPDVDALIRSMLQLNPSSRPSIKDVIASLQRIRDLEAKGARSSDHSSSKKIPSGGSSPKLVGKGLSIGRPSAGSTSSKPGGTPRLTGSLTVHLDKSR